MLWQIGFVVILIDVFYRLSVPVDTVIQYHHQKNTTPHPKEHDDKVALVELSNVILDGPTIIKVLEKNHIENIEQFKKFIGSLPGGLRYVPGYDVSEEEPRSGQGSGFAAPPRREEGVFVNVNRLQPLLVVDEETESPKDGDRDGQKSGDFRVTKSPLSRFPTSKPHLTQQNHSKSKKSGPQGDKSAADEGYKSDAYANASSGKGANDGKDNNAPRQNSEGTGSDRAPGSQAESPTNDGPSPGTDTRN